MNQRLKFALKFGALMTLILLPISIFINPYIQLFIVLIAPGMFIAGVIIGGILSYFQFKTLTPFQNTIYNILKILLIVAFFVGAHFLRSGF